MSTRVSSIAAASSLPPAVIAIAGLDPTGGAGLLADAAVIRATGLRVAGVVTASTIQGGGLPAQVGEVIAPKVVASQLARLSGGRIARRALSAIKIGLIPDAATAVVIASWIRTVPSVPVVWDPVMAASAGGRLLRGAPAAWVKVLAAALAAGRIPRARLPRVVITPNLDEARALARMYGIDVARTASPALLAPRLADAMGMVVLLTGGHAPDGDRVADMLAVGKALYVIDKPYVPGGTSMRGTGCALSSLIASQLARNVDLVTACCDASHAVTDSMVG